MDKDECPESVENYEKLRSYLTDADIGAYPRAADTAIRDLQQMVKKLREENKKVRNDLADLLPIADTVGFYEENMNIALKRANEAEALAKQRLDVQHDINKDRLGEVLKRQQAVAGARRLEKALECAIEEWQHGEIPPDDVDDFFARHPEWRIR